MADQHDAHCWITAFHLPWRIVAVGDDIIELACPNGCHTTALDMVGADFAVYCDRSALELNAAIIAAERGVAAHPGSEARN